VRIFQGRVKATEAIGGPIMILDIAGKSAEKGWLYFVKMMAFLSVLLGMLNLLPIPILDGGHIAFIAVESILRRPVSIKARLIASYVGLVLLAGLMVFAFGNDINRYWSDITSIFK
jgi:regulator of sigma E protease